jgi:cation transport ATPase
MLTGDSSAAAGAVAQRIGIEHVQAGTLPGQKAKRVQALQVGREGGRAGLPIRAFAK